MVHLVQDYTAEKHVGIVIATKNPLRPSDLDDVMSRQGLGRKKIKAKISEFIDA